MNYLKPDIKAKKLWRITRFISFLVFLTISASLSLLAFFTWKEALPIFIFVGSLIVLWRLLAMLIYPHIEYKQWFYAVSSDKLEIRHGIFFIKKIIIPIYRIQHISIIQGPFARLFKLFTVEISLASGDFKIVGLTENIARDISEKIKDSLYYNIDAGDFK